MPDLGISRERKGYDVLDARFGVSTISIRSIYISSISGVHGKTVTRFEPL